MIQDINENETFQLVSIANIAKRELRFRSTFIDTARLLSTAITHRAVMVKETFDIETQKQLHRKHQLCRYWVKDLYCRWQ